MHSNVSHTKHLLVYALVLVGIVIGILFSIRVSYVESSVTDNLSGYAWSDTIGWISFNCTDLGTCGTSPYGVKVSSAGALSGYAWSENIGWISFNAADVSLCPSGTCAPSFNKTTGVVTGWAKALAGGAGGWDGFISLSGAGYGVTATACGWGGYAWGSDVVGWVSFSGAGYGVTGTGDACKGNPPTVTLSANPVSINTGSSTTLTWTVTGAADSCTASGGWSGSKLVTGSTEVVSPLTTTTYNLECWNAGVSSGIKTVTVTVLASCPAGIAKSWTVGGNTCTANTPAASSGSNGTLTDSIAPLVGTAAYLCTNGTWAATQNPGATCNNIPAPTVTFTASPSTINSGGLSVLTWTVTGAVDSCTASGGWSGSKLVTGSTEVVSPLTTTTYNLECWNAGVSSGIKAVTVTVLASCPAGIAKSWTVGGNTCTANTPAASSGSNGTLTDSIAPLVGTAAYLCTNGTWAATQNPGATCNIPPELTADKLLVEQGTDVVLTYHPNGQICSLTGGALNLAGLNTDGSTPAQTIYGRTTYTLSCPLGSDSVTVEVVPRGFET